MSVTFTGESRGAAVVDSLVSDGRALGLGVVSGLVGASAYYSPILRPIAHTFSLWVIVVVVLSAGKATYPAVRQSFLGLAAAVVVFYVALTSQYQSRYGSSLPLNVDDIVLFIGVAVVAAVVFGSAFHWIGRPGWTGASASACAVGLLLADATRRTNSYPDDRLVCVAVSGLGVLVVAALARMRGLDWLRAAVLCPLATATCLVVVSGPDLMEQWLLP